MVGQRHFVFVSILVLVVLSAIDRFSGTIDREIARKDAGVLGIPYLGRFTVVHVLNVTLLFVGYLVVLDTYLETVKVAEAVLLLLIGLVLAALPILELDGYDRRLVGEDTPPSFLAHLAVTLLVVALLPICFVGAFLNYRLEWFETIVFTGGVLLWYLQLRTFLTRIRTEARSGLLD